MVSSTPTPTVKRTMTFVLPAQSTSANGAAPLELDEIPQDIRDEVEQAYAAIKTNPAGRVHAEFESVEDLRTYVRFVTSYCAVRPGGVIRFRKSPTRNQPENVMDFRITDPLTANEAVTEEVRAATKRANAPAKSTPAFIAPTPAAIAKKTTRAAKR